MQFKRTALRIYSGSYAGSRCNGLGLNCHTSDLDDVITVIHVDGDCGVETVQVVANIGSGAPLQQQCSGVIGIDINTGVGTDSVTLVGILASATLASGQNDGRWKNSHS